MNTMKSRLAALRSHAAPRALCGPVVGIFRDIVDNADVVASLHPAARATGTATGATVDLQGYDGAMFVFGFGAWTDGTHTPSAMHSDDSTTWTACGTADLKGTFAAMSTTAGQNALQRVGYITGKRYVRPMLVGAGITTGAPIDAKVIRGNARLKPLP